MSQTVQEFFDLSEAAWIAGDADAVAELYTADATVVTSGAALRSRAEIRQFFKTGFAGPLKGSAPLDRQESIRYAGADVAIVSSTSGIRMAGEPEVPADRIRRATWVLTREGDHWLAAAYHNSPA
ncbi:hypothetical protein ACWT_6618 [Actinoplanes sp. SE50]|uniref:YybH family protein n=1 Tax=unclassified Actinoplanes TaxID=2626549 RepID=UPI00023EC876|nr:MULTISPECIES: SgcJ/EcaC family oxidoreductase [unclassified Actinoplanes]AEV87630.1 hypothetical protein ACPL_6748 [Actinoplanes sp. SE50/110]ATO86033.1 hypothetical protein ACWT_6618 [Actinoplanes sp. SE50]SLM03447.1 hypothetical protein ACSP50_6736 [Actinoplanes sp. SE50/110]